MELHEALNLLREDSLLSAMPPALAEIVQKTASIRAVASGGVVCRQGDLADRLIIALTTPLRLSLVASDGTAQSVGQLGVRRALNLSAILSSAPWDYTATAEGEGFLLEADAAAFRAALIESPEYARYLERITTRRSVRELVRVLRAGSIKSELIQRFVGALDERSFDAGEVILVPDPAQAAWALVDSGHCELAVQRGGARVELATLDVGDFYGGSTILLRMRAVELKALVSGKAFLLSADALRSFAEAEPALRHVLGREKPELVRKLRRALIEVGAEFTKALSAPLDLPESEQTGHTKLPGAIDALAPLGDPWAPSGVQARRLEGARVSIEEDTGPAALAALFTAHGRTVSLSVLRKRLRRQPPSLLDLASQAEREGFSTHASKIADPKLLGRLDLPLLAVLGRRYVVIHALRGGWVFFFDPISGLRKMKLKALRGLFAGAVLTLRDVRTFLRGADVKPGEEAAQGLQLHLP